VIGEEPDPRGPAPRGAPTIRLEGHAQSSGVLALLATVTDDLVSQIDARTGAAVVSQNIIEYAGLGRPAYRRRVTTTTFAGRGLLHLEDRRDDQVRGRTVKVPLDTFDPLSAMAWVRSLALAPGERARAHAMDGAVLLRIEIVSRGRKPPKTLPAVAPALGVSATEIELIEGVLTRVDAFDRPIPGKRAYSMRAYLSADSRRLPLLVETDMWLGSLRLELTQYDPPRVESRDTPPPHGI
jgi:hypothetical protein